jgi:hypothetical protein
MTTWVRDRLGGGGGWQCWLVLVSGWCQCLKLNAGWKMEVAGAAVQERAGSPLSLYRVEERGRQGQVHHGGLVQQQAVHGEGALGGDKIEVVGGG